MKYGPQNMGLFETKNYYGEEKTNLFSLFYG